MVFFVKSVKHTFYTLHTIIPDFGDVRKLTGYSPFTINPQADKLVSICKALDMSLVDLLCDEEEVKSTTGLDFIVDGQ